MAVHKLIIAEKPSVAEAIAHTVGARDKVYAKESKNFAMKETDTTLPMRQVIFIVSVSPKIMDIRNGL